MSVVSVAWFILSATDAERAYEVTVDRIDADVSINSEQVQYDVLIAELGDLGGQRDVPPIRVVNRSGVAGAAAQVAFNLTELGYAIESVGTELNESTERTVVVFDPAFADQALDLSVTLGTALLSSFEAASTDPLIAVYVGKDVASKVTE